MRTTTDKAVARMLVLAVKKGMITPAKVLDIHSLLGDLAVDYSLEAEANSGSRIEEQRGELARDICYQIEEELERAGLELL